MAAKSLTEKLLIKLDMRLAVLNPPKGYIDNLGELPKGVEMDRRLAGQFDSIQLFIKSSAELKRYLLQCLNALKKRKILDCLSQRKLRHQIGPDARPGLGAWNRPATGLYQ